MAGEDIEKKENEERAHKEVRKYIMATFVAAVGIAGCLGYCGADVHSRMRVHESSRANHVEIGKLEMGLEDVYDDGDKEPIIMYDGKSYLLSLDNQGNLKLQDYEPKQ